VAGLGPVSSLDPASKLLSLALLSSAALFASPALALALAFGAILLLLKSGLRLGTVLRESSIIALFALFAAALRLIGLPGSLDYPQPVLAEAGAYGLRLLTAFMLGRLFYASTPASELRDAGTRIARRLPFVRALDLGLGLSLILGFVPLIFEEWRSSLEAARSRGLTRRAPLTRQALFVAAFLRRLMLRAVATPEALVARGWSRERGLVPSRWGSKDTLLCCGSAMILAAAALRLV
jgi:energy-coupling factor transporter transmembrane protein EcfT